MPEQNISNYHTTHQIRRPSKLKWLVQRLGIFLIFFILAGALFGSIQWFSESIRPFLFWSIQGLSGRFSTGSLETRASLLPFSEISNSGQKLLEQEIPSEQETSFTAKSAISVQVDGKSRKIDFAKYEKERLPIASLTKLMTALVALEDYSLDQKVAISEQSIAQGGRKKRTKKR